MRMTLRHLSLVLAFIASVCFVLATPQQQASTPTSSSASPANPTSTCLKCPPPTCDPVCKGTDICVYTVQTCHKCPVPSCQSGDQLLRNAQGASAPDSSSSSSSSSKIVPIAIGGVCGGLGVAAAIAGLIWYRQRRRSQENRPRYGAQLNATGVYAGSRHNMSGFKSPYAASRQTGFSEENESIMDENDRFSISRPPTAWGGFQAAVGATEALADITSVTIDSKEAPLSMHMAQTHSTQGSDPYMAASLGSHNAYDHTNQSMTESNTSSISKQQLNTPPMTLGAMVAAATAAVSKDMNVTSSSYTGRMMNVLDTHQIERTSMAESAHTDFSDQIEVTRARKTTVKSGQSVTYVDNVENYITPGGQISRSATISDRSSRRQPRGGNTATADDDQHSSSFDATTIPTGLHDSLFPVSNTTQIIRDIKEADYNYNHLQVDNHNNNHDDDDDAGWPRTSFARNIFSSLPESATLAPLTATTMNTNINTAPTTHYTSLVPANTAVTPSDMNNAYHSTRDYTMRPESEIDPSNALYNLARAVAEEDNNMPLPVPKINYTAQPSAVVDVTIQLPDSIRAAMEADEMNADIITTNTGRETRQELTDPSDTNSGYWQWRQQMIDSARDNNHNNNNNNYTTR
ncbi:hypothetical protein BDF22DRAFT_745886 [Syncephalis plumigaleata]|nr:hypothetical protein BDF22DRAFT_745886 [Syncephalis plumigaleata]